MISDSWNNIIATYINFYYLIFLSLTQCVFISYSTSLVVYRTSTNTEALKHTIIVFNFNFILLVCGYTQTDISYLRKAKLNCCCCSGCKLGLIPYQCTSSLYTFNCYFYKVNYLTKAQLALTLSINFYPHQEYNVQ